MHNFVIDSHLDLGGIIKSRRDKGMTHVLETLFLETFQSIQLKVVVGAIFVENNQLETALKEALSQIQAIKDDIKSSKIFKLITNKSELDQLFKSDGIGIILSLEGLEPIGRHLELIDIFYDLGIRAAGLTWSRRNLIADGSYFRNPREGILGGLTPFGIEVVEKLEAKGMMIDISHLNDTGVSDVFQYTKNSVLASHSNTRALCTIPRNLTDEQINMISKRSGIIGVNAYHFIVDEKAPSLEKLCNHIEHIAQVGGHDVVGFGFDFCNLYYDNGKNHDVIHYDDIPELLNRLENKGWSKEAIDKLCWRNHYDFFMKHLPE